MRIAATLLTTAAMLMLVAAANAQGNFDAFLEQDAEAQAREGVGDEELRQFEEVLNGADADRALRAMRFMLASGKPRLVRRAMEFGLFAAEPLFRHEALRAIFEAGGPFRIEVDLSGPQADESKMLGTVLYWGGSNNLDGTAGYYVFSTDPYDSEDRCWKFEDSSKCAFYLTRDVVSLKDWTYASGNLVLSSSGVLEGNIQNTNGPGKPAVPAADRPDRLTTPLREYAARPIGTAGPDPKFLSRPRPATRCRSAGPRSCPARPVRRRLT